MWKIVARIPFLYIAVSVINAEMGLTSLLMLIGFSKAVFISNTCNL